MSLGINVLPPRLKVCSFNCCYCQYGWTAQRDAAAVPTDEWPSARQIAESLETFVRRSPDVAATVDRLTLAGHGEPTLHPDFGTVIARLRAARDACLPRSALAILSNSSTAGDPAVRAALGLLDERYMKLDAGDPLMFRRLNGSLAPLSAIAAGLRGLGPLVVQAMFVRDETGRVDNSSDAAISQWLPAVADLHPLAVHIYTLDRDPAWSRLRPVSAHRLLEIGRRVRGCGIPAHVFASHG